MRKLFNLKGLAQPLIRYINIDNGANTFLWLDNWHAIGPLFARFGNVVVTDVGSSLLYEVSSIISEGVWRWPRYRNRAIQQIMEMN